MLKILYAAGNNDNAKIQLERFLAAITNLPFTIKIAAYKRSSPKCNVDWTLDSLLNVFNPDLISTDNENFTTYLNQIKTYNPDLVISDLEYFTSEIAIHLGIQLWQCSSFLINFATSHDFKYNLSIYRNYSYIFNRDNRASQRLLNIQLNSERNFIYSHFGDCVDAPSINSKYEWIRPYHPIGKPSKLCHHNIMGCTPNSDKKLLNSLSKYEDAIYFTNTYEQYKSPEVKDINNHSEYSCNLANCDIFMTNGVLSLLADAFYNGKYTVNLYNLEPDNLLNSLISEKLKLSSTEIPAELPEIIPNLSPNICFLHEKLLNI